MYIFVRESFRLSAVVIVALLFLTTTASAQSIKRCVIAAESSGAYSYSTATVTSCQVDTRNGRAIYKFKGEARERTYTSKVKMTQRHFNVAKRLLRQTKRIKVNPNPANFDVQYFLQEAAKADKGMVFVRARKGKRALTIVFITNGVYRSIDLNGTNLRDVPAGFLTTAARS